MTLSSRNLQHFSQHPLPNILCFNYVDVEMNIITQKHPLCELDYISSVRQRALTIPKELEMRAFV
jgi:hypothetical protein